LIGPSPLQLWPRRLSKMLCFESHYTPEKFERSHRSSQTVARRRSGLVCPFGGNRVTWGATSFGAGWPMNRRTLVVAIGSVALRVLGCSSAGQSQGPSTPVTQEDVGNAGLPPPLEVPAGNRLTSSLDGSGVQVYQCATGLARTAYRRRMLTCSPARQFRCSARDDVDGRGGYPSNSVAGTIRSPRRASRGWDRYEAGRCSTGTIERIPEGAGRRTSRRRGRRVAGNTLTGR
jgi:hypothetical protein